MKSKAGMGKRWVVRSFSQPSLPGWVPGGKKRSHFSFFVFLHEGVFGGGVWLDRVVSKTILNITRELWLVVLSDKLGDFVQAIPRGANPYMFPLRPGS